MFQKVKFAYELVPEYIDCWEYIWKKPTPQYDNVNEYYFPELNSRIKIALDSRSMTVTDLHISELAFIQNAEQMFIWSLPSAEYADITIETTANWLNFFKDFREKNKIENNFKNFFIPRYKHSEYRSKPPKWRVLPDEITNLNWIKLTKEQQYWYYKQRKMNPRFVKQEYPTTDIEAFLTTWDHFFNLSIIELLPKLSYNNDEKYNKLRWYKQPDEYCVMWVDTSLWWQEWDYSAIVVRDRLWWLVCTYYDHTPPDILVDVIDYIFEKWFLWIVAIENNNTWISTIDNAKHRWRSIYLYSQEIVDEHTRQKTKKLWWNTNSKTRPIMYSDYEKMIREWEINEFDERQKQEMKTIIYNEQKKPEAMKWHHDDLVVADAICCQMLLSQYKRI
jgi:hypothetical protein